MNPAVLAALAFGAWWFFFRPGAPTAQQIAEAAVYGGGPGESPPELRGAPAVVTLAPGQAPPAVLPVAVATITPGAVARSPRRRG